MKYQDELECDHCKNIDEEISKFRKKQMDKMEDKLEKILNKKKSKEKKTEKNSHDRDFHRKSLDNEKDSRYSSNFSRRNMNESSARHSNINREERDRLVKKTKPNYFKEFT